MIVAPLKFVKPASRIELYQSFCANNHPKRHISCITTGSGFCPFTYMPPARIVLKMVKELKQSAFQHLRTLGNTLFKWREEVVRMLRFTKNNGITEGFHRKKWCARRDSNPDTLVRSLMLNNKKHYKSTIYDASNHRITA